MMNDDDLIELEINDMSKTLPIDHFISRCDYKGNLNLYLSQSAGKNLKKWKLLLHEGMLTLHDKGEKIEGNYYIYNVYNIQVMMIRVGTISWRQN